MDNYPDDIRAYDNDPRSPLFDEDKTDPMDDGDREDQEFTNWRDER